MTMKWALFTLQDLGNLLLAGAIVRDELEYYNTLDQDDVLGAPVYLNRAQIGVVRDDVVEALEAQHEGEDRPSIVKSQLLYPGMPLHYYWHDRKNEDVALFEVAVRYLDSRVSHLDVVYSIAEEEERVADDEFSEETLDPGTKALYDALNLEYGVAEDAEEDEEEDDANDDEEEDDSDDDGDAETDEEGDEDDDEDQ